MNNILIQGQLTENWWWKGIKMLKISSITSDIRNDKLLSSD